MLGLCRPPIVSSAPKCPDIELYVNRPPIPEPFAHPSGFASSERIIPHYRRKREHAIGVTVEGDALLNLQSIFLLTLDADTGRLSQPRRNCRSLRRIVVLQQKKKHRKGGWIASGKIAENQHAAV